MSLKLPIPTPSARKKTPPKRPSPPRRPARKPAHITSACK